VSPVGHGDADLLGIDIWINGVHLIADPGVLTYNVNSPDFEYYKSVVGQNAPQVDRLEPWVVTYFRPRLLPSYLDSQAQIQGKDLEGALSLTGSHTGYHRLSDPVTINRQIILEGDGDLQVQDRFEGLGIHRIDIQYHLSTELQVTGGDREWQVHDPISGYTFSLIFDGPESMLVNNSVAPAALDYGVKTQTPLLHVSLETALPSCVGLRIVPSRPIQTLSLKN
jgi:hypothetical protein